MRFESSVTSLSWIPQGATEGFNRLTFGLLRVAHYDPPPPDVLGDLRASIAFASAAMPDVRPEPELGPTARFVQTGGGVVGIPTPRRVRRPPYVQIRPSIPWTTLALTIHADGTAEPWLTGASPFPGTGSTTTPASWSSRAALSWENNE